MTQKNQNHQNDNQNNLEEELILAKEAFEKNEIEHALFHLGLILEENPNHQESIQILEEILNKAENPLIFTERSENEYQLSKAVLDSYIFAREDNYREAIHVMGSIFKFLKDSRFFSWICKWLADPERANVIESYPIGYILATSHDCDDYITRQQNLKKIEKIIPTLEKLSILNPKDSYYNNMFSRTLRDLKKYEMALEIAEKNYENQPDLMSMIYLGGALHDIGDIERAIEIKKRALEFDDKYVNVGIFNDIGDHLCELKQYKEAINYYKQALNIDPENGWAKPHYLFYSYILDSDDKWKKEFLEFYTSNPDASLSFDVEEILEPYVDFLPTPQEAMLKLAASKLSKKELTIEKIASSSLEPPTAYYITRLCNQSEFKIGVAEIQTPDPRIPRKDVKYLLWEYDDVVPIRAVKPPSKKMQDLVVSIADLPFNLNIWAENIRSTMKKVKSKHLEDLLSVMVYWPALKRNIAPWDWFFRVQVACALMIAHSDEKWNNSVRKDMLLSLLNGPLDWTVDAAVIALTYIGFNDDNLTEEILKSFLEVLSDLPRPGHVSYQRPLLYGSLKLCSKITNLPNGLEENLKNLLNALKSFEKGED